jgi:hypothetical protein
MITALSLFLAAATAQSGVASPTPVKDPDPIICERQTEMGSRLRSKKICKHRSEWAEDRRSDRANIEQSQRSGMKGE